MSPGEPMRKICADLILLHAPSVFDFREREDVLFPYVASDSVAASSIFEVYPLGFKSIESYLRHHGRTVRIINLAALMLRHWDLNVRAFLRSLDARVFGIDLHWVVHAHGAIALAEELKAVHPRTPVLLGGISSTYFGEELMQYPHVDMVMRGFDTHEPVRRLVEALAEGRDIGGIPNLIHRDADGGIHVNEFSHKPRSLDPATAPDWGSFVSYRKNVSPAMMLLSSTGCAYNCGWCGGSRNATARIMKTSCSRTVAQKLPETIARELGSMNAFAAARKANIYTLNAYNFSTAGFQAYLAGVKAAGIRDVSYEQFNLTPVPMLRQMIGAARTTINLSPESHDAEISRLAGRGNYTMEEMERWIEQALALGVYSVHVWFFIGMPRQTCSSVEDTVAYCRHLMERFKRQRVVPILTPMVPFLDPGCNYFEHPESCGYKVFFRSIEDHRQALVHPNWIQRINYETRWLSREQLAALSYDAIDLMTQAKRDAGMLPDTLARQLLAKRGQEKDLLFRIAEIWAAGGLDAVVGRCGAQIRAFNERAFRAGVSDQIYPVPRTLENRWFDEFAVSIRD